jgi:hypothetical protein
MPLYLYTFMSPENDSRKILTQALMNLHQQLDRPKNSREPVAILRPHRPDAGLRDDLPRYSR